MTAVDPLRLLDAHDIVWEGVGRTDRSGIPLGNGELGALCWVDADGLHCYLGRSDALTELDRNVKVGLVDVALKPNPFATGDVSQHLRLRDGQLRITAVEGDQRVDLTVFVAADEDVLYVLVDAVQPVQVAVGLTSWRTEPRAPGPDSTLAGWPGTSVMEAADETWHEEDATVLRHVNGPTCIPVHIAQQGLSDYADLVPDTLGGRVFGGRLTLADSDAAGPGRLCSRRPVHAAHVTVATHSAQVPPDAWADEIRAIATGAYDPSAAAATTAAAWADYWSRSWLFLGDELADVGRAYVLTKWMHRCQSVGRFPIYYNGGLFTGMPGLREPYDLPNFAASFTREPDGPPDLLTNPDERTWVQGHLWQNLRLPYHSMLARGEVEPVRRLADFLHSFHELDAVRSRLYHDVDGLHSAEMVTSFGLQQANIYGFDRDGLPVGRSANRWGGSIEVSPGLEQVHLLLDLVDHLDEPERAALLRDAIVPLALGLLSHVAGRFGPTGGTLAIGPLHAVETYFDTTDPTPVVAGLHAVTARLTTYLPPGTPERDEIDTIARRLPPLPLVETDDGSVIGPARVHDGVRQNCETPELYAIFPFRLLGLGRDDLALGRRTFARAMVVSGALRPWPLGAAPTHGASPSGWQQVGMCAALLGLTDVAAGVVRTNCGLGNPGHRFPAMWGPIYDAVPDIDHGSNILTTLQLMALQTVGDAIHVLPAWPREWDLDFRLHAPRSTVVTGRLQDGKLASLQVQPSSRATDIATVLGEPVAMSTLHGMS